MDTLIYYNKHVAEFFTKEDNIEFIQCNKASNTHLICFSDNGLFYPWTEEIFNKIILEKNRFQWRNITRDPRITEKFNYIVFVRDIYQSWYIKGISAELNSPHKVSEKIKKITGEKGEYITIGSSAGGYYAVLIGILLNAKHIISISGQFLIGNQYETNPLIKNAETRQKNYFNLSPYITTYSGNIFYFCPYNCERDRVQYEIVKNIKNVYCFKFRSARHGNVLIPQNIQWVIASDSQTLLEVYRKEYGKIINERIFLIKSVGFFKGIRILIKRLYLHKICHKY